MVLPLPPALPPLICTTCRYWGHLRDGGGTHRYCQQPDNLQDLGSMLRAFWERCGRWAPVPSR